MLNECVCSVVISQRLIKIFIESRRINIKESLSLRQRRNEVLERKFLHALEVVEVGEPVHILSWEDMGGHLNLLAQSQVKVGLIVDNDSGH